jgi:osmotically inducible protein OsmC
MISGVHLDVTARIPGIDALLFERAAAQAKSTCPISTALKTKITLEARLSAM